MRTIAVANQKGGVGKTTTSVTLAHGLALRGHDVLLIDLDPQGHCAAALGRDPEPGVFRLMVADHPLKEVVRSTGRPHLTLLPGDKRTATAQVVLLAEGRLSRDLLLTILRPVARTGLTFCVIDASPTVTGLQEAALYAADLLVIPTSCDYLAAQGVAGMMSALKVVNSEGGGCRLLGILPTFYDDQTKETRATLAKMVAVLGEDVVLPPVHRATVLRECAAKGKTILEYAPEGRAAREYGELVSRVEDFCRRPDIGRERVTSTNGAGMPESRQSAIRLPVATLEQYTRRP